MPLAHPPRPTAPPSLPLPTVRRSRRPANLAYAWRTAAAPQPKKAPQGLALAWWLKQLESPATRKALLERHLYYGTDVD